jgi:hypothetical protein
MDEIITTIFDKFDKFFETKPFSGPTTVFDKKHEITTIFDIYPAVLLYVPFTP